MTRPIITSAEHTTKSRRFEVGEAAVSSRLDQFLAERLREFSRIRIATLLDQGSVKVNGQTARAGLRLRCGDCVEVEAGEPVLNFMTAKPLPLEVVYEDEHLVVVIKPAGMLMHPTRGVKSGTLVNALTYWLGRDESVKSVTKAGESGLSEAESGGELIKSNAGEREVDAAVAGVSEPADETAPDPHPRPTSSAASFIRPGLVHRLDRATSGLVVVTKTQAALSRLSDHFKRRLVEKRYLAILHGKVEADEMEINAPIGREEDARPHWRVTEEGRHAETRLRVLARRGRQTLVELEPVTGRTNQLRIHCAHIGHPVAGDEWHAADGQPRLCLHAARLAFNHPATNERMSFLSPLPAELEIVWHEGVCG